MGLEFSFDEISLDQQVSREQLEIDLYDELITISDAEPDEQIRLLAAKPSPVNSEENDKPESIRVTASLARDHLLAGGMAAPPLAMAADTDLFEGASPPVPARPTRPPMIHTGPVSHPAATITNPEAPGPVPPPNGRVPTSSQPAALRRNVVENLHQQIPPQAPVAAPSKAIRPPSPPVLAPTPPRPAPMRPAPAAPAGSCPDCGQPAGELDMICIECGAFIG